LKFRRQVPIGRYIADFFSEDLQLVIELDGGQHADSEKDAVRTRYLESQGLRMVRFWNNDLLANIEGVLESLRIVAAEARHRPSPSGEGGASAREGEGPWFRQRHFRQAFTRAGRKPLTARFARTLSRGRGLLGARVSISLSRERGGASARW
jgi:hypothetical protein